MVPSGFTMASTVAVWLMMTAEWSENVTCTSPSGRTTKRTRLGESAMAARREPGLAGRDSTADCSRDCSPFVTYKKVACSLPLYFLAGAYRARAMPVHLGASHSPRACD